MFPNWVECFKSKTGFGGMNALFQKLAVTDKKVAVMNHCTTFAMMFVKYAQNQYSYAQILCSAVVMAHVHTHVFSIRVHVQSLLSFSLCKSCADMVDAVHLDPTGRALIVAITTSSLHRAILILLSIHVCL